LLVLAMQLWATSWVTLWARSLESWMVLAIPSAERLLAHLVGRGRLATLTEQTLAALKEQMLALPSSKTSA
jgi:hypothetical protein